MRDMDKAVARIEQAWERQENIMVYGDYDVDGTTSVALMTSYLKETTTKVTLIFQTDILKDMAFPTAVSTKQKKKGSVNYRFRLWNQSCRESSLCQSKGDRFHYL